MIDDRVGLRFTPDGWIEGVRRVASPNWDRRPPDARVTLAVVHGISLPPGRFGGDEIFALFTNTLDCDAQPFFAGLKDLRVSAHFLVRRDGELIQFVSCDARAWHAGVSRWRGQERCNDFSIGIELEGIDTVAYTDSQYRTLAALLSAVRCAYPVRDIAGHSDIAPGRKTDPGPAFDWSRVALA